MKCRPDSMEPMNENPYIGNRSHHCIRAYTKEVGDSTMVFNLISAGANSSAPVSVYQRQIHSVRSIRSLKPMIVIRVKLV